MKHCSAFGCDEPAGEWSFWLRYHAPKATKEIQTAASLPAGDYDFEVSVCWSHWRLLHADKKAKGEFDVALLREGLNGE